MTGAVAEAEQLLADPTQAADSPTDHECELIRALILLARGDRAAAVSIASAVAAQAGATGYELFGIIADHVLAATAARPPLTRLGRLLWVAGDDPPASSRTADRPRE